MAKIKSVYRLPRRANLDFGRLGNGKTDCDVESSAALRAGGFHRHAAGAYGSEALRQSTDLLFDRSADFWPVFHRLKSDLGARLHRCLSVIFEAFAMNAKRPDNSSARC